MPTTAEDDAGALRRPRLPPLLPGTMRPSAVDAPMVNGSAIHKKRSFDESKRGVVDVRRRII